MWRDVSTSSYWQAFSRCVTRRQEVTVTWLGYRHLVRLHRGPLMFAASANTRQVLHVPTHTHTAGGNEWEEEDTRRWSKKFRVSFVLFGGLLGENNPRLVHLDDGFIVSYWTEWGESCRCSSTWTGDSVVQLPPIYPGPLKPNFLKLSQLIIRPLCQEGNQAWCSK